MPLKPPAPTRLRELTLAIYVVLLWVKTRVRFGPARSHTLIVSYAATIWTLSIAIIGALRPQLAATKY